MTSDNQAKTGDAGASSNEKQNQLKFEFSNMEPITPKKPIEEKPSFLDKAKGLLPKREHKEESVNPTNPQQSAQTPADTENTAQAATHDSVEKLNENSETTAREPLSQRLKKPETWELLNRLPAKHRRLFIALLALILVLLIFFWLKPSSTTTVDALQAQNANSLPIEFQPLNQSEEEMVNQPVESGSETNILLPDSNINATAPSQSDNSSASLSETVSNTAAAATLAQQQAQQTQQAAQATPTAQPQTTAAPTRSTAVKEPVRKAEPNRTTAATTAQTRTTTQPKTTAPAKTAADSAPASSRTLTIPQGVTLMQVFRNNNLNIADVNAMTKANGGEKALSSFKPGDKVTIQLNSQGRVSRLTLQNGSTFSRNSDGSYNYKK
ncbi:LysM-like peptidoglycan-binding domain-containing protein [Pasteurella testudinis]|uniref:LysM-like peptidoglycan-binding domain-containing protein n=1 Tax=Pasteurella testudinis TaxID=761 RepID=UPI004059678B